MDLSTVLSKIDLHQYGTVKEYLEDVDLIWQNALEYNPDRDPSGTGCTHFHSKHFICSHGTLERDRRQHTRLTENVGIHTVGAF